MFKCAEDDSKSIIYRSGAGADTKEGELRTIFLDRSKLEVVKKLGDGESFDMTVRVDGSLKERKIRFTHKKNTC